MGGEMLSTIADIALIATPIVVAVGFGFAYRQWQAERNTRMAQLITSLMSMWISPEMAESRCKLNKSGSNLKRDYEAADKANQPEAYGMFTRVVNFFDGVGVLLSEGFLDTHIAYDLFGKAEKTYYRLYEPMITTQQYEEYVPYFIKLHQLFIKEEARCSQVKKRRAS